MSKRTTFARPQGRDLARRLADPRRFLQVVAGPRQVGKTTLVRQVLADLRLANVQASADEPALRGRAWIEQQWEAARMLASESGPGGAVLVLDEIQKVPGWSETVKRLWDEDSARRRPAQGRAARLGAAAHPAAGSPRAWPAASRSSTLPHWSLAEMREAFGWSLERLPLLRRLSGSGAARREPGRWTRYVQDALIETTISRDVLLLTRVDKPALLRRLFELGCRYSRPGALLHRRCSASSRTRATRRRWRTTSTCSPRRGNGRRACRSTPGTACASAARARSCRC